MSRSSSLFPVRVCSFVILASMVLATGQGFAQDDDEAVNEFDSISEMEPGDTGLLKAADGMDYFLSIPESYDETKGARLVIFLHGSNMNGRAYMQGIEQKKWCKADILCCPNGEASGDDPYGANNFGFASANPISELTKEVQDELNTTLTYIGGHSQGGFVTYSCIMHYPDLYHGAFPMAGDCWMQNEPNLWDSQPDKVEAQKKIAIAVIHGQNDQVVSFSQGEHAFGVFAAACYPKIRFFKPEALGHQFIFSPVGEALEWLDAMNGQDPPRAMNLAKEWVKDGEWGWAVQAAIAVKDNLDADETSIETANKVLERVNTPAKEAASNMSAKIKGDESGSWVPEWFEFHRQYGATEAAKGLVENYFKRRQMSSESAEKLFWEAQTAFREDKDKAAYDKYEEILKDHACTYQAYYAHGAIARRDAEKKKNEKPFR